jgi:hydrogenase maturation protease
MLIDALCPAGLSATAGRIFPPGIQVQDAGLPGWGLPSWLEGWDSVFLIDAVEMGQEPGSWRKFCLEDVKYGLDDQTLSLHQPDLACGLALAKALDLLPENLVIYGVQPADTTPGASLSPQVSACLPELIEQILYDLGQTKNATKANPHS